MTSPGQHPYVNFIPFRGGLYGNGHRPQPDHRKPVAQHLAALVAHAAHHDLRFLRGLRRCLCGGFHQPPGPGGGRFRQPSVLFRHHHRQRDQHRDGGPGLAGHRRRGFREGAGGGPAVPALRMPGRRSGEPVRPDLLSPDHRRGGISPGDPGDRRDVPQDLRDRPGGELSPAHLERPLSGERRCEEAARDDVFRDGRQRHRGFRPGLRPLGHSPAGIPRDRHRDGRFGGPRHGDQPRSPLPDPVAGRLPGDLGPPAGDDPADRPPRLAGGHAPDRLELRDDRPVQHPRPVG